MNTSTLEPLATRVSFDSDNMWVHLKDGRQIGVPLAYFPRLLEASAGQRKKCVISGGGIGLHWDALDEDISVPALLHGRVARPLRTTKKTRKAA